MDENYVGEIRLFAGSYAPQGWHLCDGSKLLIKDNQMLYALLGVRYGGDGQTYFCVPDLRGRVPLGRGTGPGLTPRATGEAGGAETVAATEANLPTHTPAFYASTAKGTTDTPGPTVTRAALPTGSVAYYSPPSGTTPPTQNLAPGTITSAGGSQSHGNLMPTTCINFIIALNGLWPNQN
ncbi:MAG: phage tail protein [Alphaproteobacteria bacterium]|nr:phage tail protein [Alphaproteobacteria bacterium]